MCRALGMNAKRSGRWPAGGLEQPAISSAATQNACSLRARLFVNGFVIPAYCILTRPYCKSFGGLCSKSVHDDDEQPRHPEDQAIGEGATRDLRQRVAQDAEDERPDYGSHHRSAPTGERCAANHGRRDDVELVAIGQIGFALSL